MPTPLTDRQAQVLRHIAEHIVQWQRPPTRKEISRHFGWSAVNAAEDHIKALASRATSRWTIPAKAGRAPATPECCAGLMACCR